MKLYDTLSSGKTCFMPLNSDCVKMYVCGPTVYDFVHLGNMRSAVAYDILFRLLKALYPKVIYVRNITDIDDKIINAVHSKCEDIKEFTSRYTEFFHEDMQELNCLEPTFEPRATEEIPCMLEIISKLIDKGHAYVVKNTVYFSVASHGAYGRLSKRKQEEMVSGTRVDIDEDKRHPGDFVLWKPATDVDLRLGAYWDSPWGKGRPGWHIECSAMSYKYCGDSFDIHGGGADLMFPHHENELAQNNCAFPDGVYAKYWVHNGFLTVNGGEKMSKSLGNVLTVRELKEKGVDGQVMRYVFLSTHYRKPLDWNDKVVSSAKVAMKRISRACQQLCEGYSVESDDSVQINEGVMEALLDDMNTPKAISIVHDMVTQINKMRDVEGRANLAKSLVKSMKFMGMDFVGKEIVGGEDESEWGDTSWIEASIAERNEARRLGNFALADRIRDELRSRGVVAVDEKDGKTSWYFEKDSDK
ncbi:cysteine--tRNA ligase [Anaplasma bovis]|uniref:cysteine--tRNA ligase n=1 Tax=Anaplasma bovis TaxID=186733 RepID=UPI002FF41612